MEKFEGELEHIKKYAGANKKCHPLRWIKWESTFKSASGTHAPPWREKEGDLGNIIASTQDKGVVVILCKQDGKCYRIKGYSVARDANEKLNYEKDGPECESLVDVLSEASGVFKEIYPKREDGEIESDVIPKVNRQVMTNELVTLPQPVLVLNQPTQISEEETDQDNKQEDDEKIVPFTKPSSSETEYWALHAKLKEICNPDITDPTKNDLIELSENQIFREQSGQRAIYQTGSIPALVDILRLKQSHGFGDARINQQASVLKIFSMISTNALIRRHLATEDFVKVILEIMKREEMTIIPSLLTTIANCCHNTAFREFFIDNSGIDQLILLVKISDIVAMVCNTLWAVNRSERATQIMIEKHLIIELERYTNPCIADEEQMLNITKVFCSFPKYGPKIFEPLKSYHIKFFCLGLQSKNPDCVSWAAMALTAYPLEPELQKLFCSKGQDGPMSLRNMLDSKNTEVILAGLNCIVTLGQIEMIRNALIPSVHSKLQNLWQSENTDIKKSVLKVIGVLTQNKDCLEWTQRQNLIPSLLEYLQCNDSEFVIYAAKALGTCCNHPTNLNTLMSLHGVRTLWSLMKSPVPGVQAAATRALVPFLKSPGSPTIVRTFVDGLELLVGLLRSDDPEVQESACMAVTEVAKDLENLAVMTDLGLVELLSRLLSTKLDSVRKPLADAIGVAAAWGNNRRRFGEEGAVDPLVSYLRPPSSNKDVHAATAKALKALSEDKQNSKKLSQAGVVEYLLIMVESTDLELQMAAAVAIRNIRTNRA